MLLEFLGLKDEYSESALEDALTHRLEQFLLEFGNDSWFIARQRRRRAGDEWYRVDLPFFHRRLRCLVNIDLKIGRFTHANAGQMNLFLNYARELNRAFRKHGSEPWCAIGTLSPLIVSLACERPQFLLQLK